MTEIERTELPGIGFRADVDCDDGTTRVGVLVHRSGRRELLVYGDDPDTPTHVIPLTNDDARSLAELLGTPKVEETATSALDLEGLIIDWIEVPVTSPLAGQTLAESAIHTRTGASVVAIVREHGTIVAPGAEDRIEGGDTAVVVGDEPAVTKFTQTMRGE